MLSICTESVEKRKAPNWTIGRAKTCLTAEEAIREPILVTDQRTRPPYLYFLKMISMSYYLAHIFVLALAYIHTQPPCLDGGRCRFKLIFVESSHFQYLSKLTREFSLAIDFTQLILRQVLK